MSSSTQIRKDTKKEEVKPIPKGAIILSQNVSTNVEEIENGYLITKTTDTKYKTSKDGYSDWNYETKKWYSKIDPLEIKTTDKSLADAFDETV